MHDNTINRLITECDDLLRSAWSLHAHETDILILADTACPPPVEMARKVWAMAGGKPPTKKVAGFTMTAFIWPVALIDNMAATNDPTSQELAQQLQDVAEIRASGKDVVPLLMHMATGHVATVWSPPGSGVTITRQDPNFDPETN